MGNDVFKKKITAARTRNQERDAIDKRSGFATPGDVGIVALIAVARDALEAAIVTNDMNLAAEAYVFIEDAMRLAQKDMPRG